MFETNGNFLMEYGKVPIKGQMQVIPRFEFQKLWRSRPLNYDRLFDFIFSKFLSGQLVSASQQKEKLWSSRRTMAIVFKSYSFYDLLFIFDMTNICRLFIGDVSVALVTWWKPQRYLFGLFQLLHIRQKLNHPFKFCDAR